MLTGIGGGMVRDVLVREIPTVLRTELYAVAALLGAAVMVPGKSHRIVMHVIQGDVYEILSRDDRILGMKRRALRIAVLLWLGWYLSGPLCETFDFWDPPRAEVHDVQRNAGGAPALIAAIFGVAFFLIRKWRERCSFVPGLLQRCVVSLTFYLPISVASLTPVSSHSPPLLPLRI